MKLVSINLRNGKKASVARNRMSERELKGKIRGKQGQTMEDFSSTGKENIFYSKNNRKLLKPDFDVS